MKPVADAVRLAQQLDATERGLLAAFLHRHYDLPPVLGARTMGTETDETLVVYGPSGPCAVLKIVRPETLAAAELQVDLLDHLAGRPGVRVARVIRSRDRAPLVPIDVPGHRGTALLTTFCSGSALEDHEPGTELITDVAGSLADLQRALASYPASSAAVPAEHPWSLDAVRGHAPLVARHLDPGLRAFGDLVVRRFAEFCADVRPTLATQPLHADFNLSNVLTDGSRVTAVIDFGDAVLAPRVYDVAIAVTYLAMQQPARAAEVTAAFVRSYERHAPLTEVERAALPLLVSVRALLVVLLGRETAAQHPDRATYALRYDAWGVALLEQLARPAALDPVTS
jgi:Ser/Thr protein kinase RdoA (MazF antagonist)